VDRLRSDQVRSARGNNFRIAFSDVDPVARKPVTAR